MLDSTEHLLANEDSRISRRRLLQQTGVVALGLALGGCGLSSKSSTTPSPSLSSAGPRPGGTLQVGFIGTGASDSLNPLLANSGIATARNWNIWDTLVVMDANGVPTPYLASEITPNAKADVWTVRVHSGVTWHDGSPLTADDVMYTYKRVDASPTSAASTATDPVDVGRMSKVDALTVRLPMKKAYSEYMSALWFLPIFKKDTTLSSAHPVGTGPFELESFTAGQVTVLKKNPHYWVPGRPYVDRLEMLSIPDPAARLDALLGGQVNAVESLSFAQGKSLMTNKDFTLLAANGPNMVPIYMATTLAPFQDVRVRQAMKLIADRQQLVDTAQAGLGTIGNDLFGKGVEFYDNELPQRVQDIDQAKSLLKAAGREGLSVTLNSARAAPGMLESATVFAQQAKRAGVNIKVQTVAADQYWGSSYMKQNFAQSLWYASPIWYNISMSLLPKCMNPETHWNNDRFGKIVTALLGQPDKQKRADYYYELQTILWNEGGYLIWGFFPQLDGLAKNVHSPGPNPSQPLSGWDFKDYWLAQ